MIDLPTPVPESEPAPRQAPNAIPPGTVNPAISANLRADYDALQNDLQQANELASEFQKQLAGKSNEFAHLKQVFEKTRTDLTHLQTAITALREERHRLANEAMKSTALQMKVTSLTSDRDRLRVEMEVIHEALMRATEDTARLNCQRDIQIAQLTMEVATLKQALAEAQQRSANSLRGGASHRELKTASAERLSVASSPDGDDDFINIGFSA